MHSCPSRTADTLGCRGRECLSESAVRVELTRVPVAGTAVVMLARVPYNRASSSVGGSTLGAG